MDVTYGWSLSFAAAFDDARPDSLAVLGIFLEEEDGVTDSESVKNLELATRESGLPDGNTQLNLIPFFSLGSNFAA